MLRFTPFASTLILLCLQLCLAAQPSVRQAFTPTPIQRNIEYDQPTQQEIKSCTIEADKTRGSRAWIVKDADGNLLRRFIDTNADNKIDQWCYYRNGIEVYRDIDANFNEKADQYRWFGTGGMRWGLDRNEDGRIDQWKWISPEEVSAELVEAIRDKNSQRFSTLLISTSEISKLGLKREFSDEVKTRVQAAKSGFSKHATSQKDISSKTRWIDFSAPSPGVVPAGGDQADKDLVVYENVIAVTETSGKHGELQVGTLVRVGDGWRIIDLPASDQAGFFFTVANRRGPTTATSGPQVNPKIQQLVQKLEDLDRGLSQANSPPAIRRIYQQRTVVLRQLIDASSKEERDMWLLQLVDSVVATAEPGTGDKGIKALKDLFAEVGDQTTDKEILAQAKFALMTAEYTNELQKPKADLGKIQSTWIDDLKAYVEQFSGTRPAGEAMLQLAVSQEFAGEDDDAIKWYRQIIDSFPKTEIAEKATGAVRRLRIVGKPFELRGKGIDGRSVDLATLRGRVVLVHYWATWCEPCKEDMKQMRSLLAKYGGRKFAIVGVNLDDGVQSARDHVKSNRISWPQIHDAGGLESRLAKQMGVFTLPLTMLIDESGAVVNRQITVEELEVELGKRLKKKR